MRIVFSGVHGTGKTTLLELLREQTKLSESYEFITGVNRRLQKEQHISITEKSDPRSQYTIALTNYEIYVKNKNFISDRCLLDTVSYTMWAYKQNECDMACLSFVENLLRQCKYDIIFYIEPEFQLKDDGVRPQDIEFRAGVLKCYHYYLNQWSLPIVILSGTIEQRMKTVKNTIKQKLIESIN